MATPSAVPSPFAEFDLTVDGLLTNVSGNLQLLKCSICEELLTDPVQLNCLHNCCRQCVLKSAANESNPNLTCKICQEVCAKAYSTTSNFFIESLVQQYRAAFQPTVCSFCEEDGVVDQQADVWCNQCEKHICFSCIRGHKKYNKEHVPVPLEPNPAEQANVPAGSSFAAASLRLCRLHKKPFDHVCVHCKLPKCFVCALECSGSEHEMHLLKSPKTDALLAEIRLEVRKLKELLQSKIGVLYSCQKMAENLLAARSVDMSTLEENKRAALRAVDNVYQTTEDVLKNCYDDLAPKAQELATFAEGLQAKAVHAVSYCEEIDRSGDVVIFIQQEAVLRNRLQSLAALLRDVRTPVSATDCVSLNAARAPPSDITSVACAWIGCPKIATYDFFEILKNDDASVEPLASSGPDCIMGEHKWLDIPKKCESTQTLDMTRLETNAERTSSQAMNCHSAGTDGEIGVMRVADYFHLYEEKNLCYDLAVTFRNTIVVAQGDAGLVEYDFVEHNIISDWYPPSSDSVSAVDVIDAYCVVVGLREAEAVVVLQYYADFNKWFEHVRLQLNAAPFTLSVCGDVIAVSEFTRPEFGTSLIDPGPILNLWSLSGQSLLLRKPLHFSIFSVAATDNTVAIVSQSSGGPNRERNREQYFVVGYGHNCSRRWQRVFTDRVYDICASPSSRVLYLAIRNANRVMAIGENTGCNLIDVCCDGNNIKNSWRMSISKGDGPAVLTVLESDFKTISVYPIVALTMLPASSS